MTPGGWIAATPASTRPRAMQLVDVATLTTTMEVTGDRSVPQAGDRLDAGRRTRS